MVVFEAVLVLLVIAVVLSMLARKLNVPYPAFLALVGAALALAPIAPPFPLDPTLALALFVAPVLLDAAYDTSVRDLMADWLPVGSMVLFAVGLTTAVVAWIARTLAPDLSWPAAIALGAIVAPPDAAAATAVLRQLNPPHRVVVILEGESLLNDASALLIYRLAVGAAMTHAPFDRSVVAPAFLLSVAGSLIAGPVLAKLMMWLTRDLRDAPSSIVLQFVATFGVWILAERLGMSPILAVVAYGMTISRFAPSRMPAAMRIPSYAVWETAVLVLNAVAFVLIGLQLRPILVTAPPGELPHWLAFAGAALVGVIGMRIAWVQAHGLLIRLLRGRRTPLSPELSSAMAKGQTVVSWCGMRGIVTLATAMALPEQFPHRGLLLFTAFGVTLGTLVLQGLTLRPLMLWLDLHDDRPVEREVRVARHALAKAALLAIRDEPGAEAETLRREFEADQAATLEEERGATRVMQPTQLLRRRTLEPRRAKLLQLRKERLIGDNAFHHLEAELDYAELASSIHTET
jgi:Na+/H+ antiporter